MNRMLDQTVVENVEPVLEQPVGAVEVRPQPAYRGWAAAARKCLRARITEELPVNADEHVRLREIARC